MVFKSPNRIYVPKNAAVRWDLRQIVQPLRAELSAFCIILRTVLPSFSLSAGRICSLPVSPALPAAALNQGTMQRSCGSLGIQCRLFNFKVELNPIQKRNLDIFYSNLVTWLCFHKQAGFSLVSMAGQMH